MIFGFFYPLLKQFNIEHCYVDPWYQVNEATIVLIRFYYTTLLPKRSLNCEYGCRIILIHMI